MNAEIQDDEHAQRRHRGALQKIDDRGWLHDSQNHAADCQSRATGRIRRPIRSNPNHTNQPPTNRPANPPTAEIGTRTGESAKPAPPTPETPDTTRCCGLCHFTRHIKIHFTHYIK
jgi:hypothetical protein